MAKVIAQKVISAGKRFRQMVILSDAMERRGGVLVPVVKSVTVHQEYDQCSQSWGPVRAKRYPQTTEGGEV